jgi:hypothetical protein
MNIARKVFGFLVLAFALAGFAVPASAQKVFTLSVAKVDSTTVAVTIHNVSPPTESNSTINSFRIRGSVTLAGGAAASPSQPATVKLESPPNSLKVNNFTGVKADPLLPNSITINVQLASSIPCGTTTFYVDAFAGNSLNGATFNQTPSASGGSVTLNCYALTGMPNSIAAGKQTTFNATLQNLGTAPISTVTFAPSGSNVTVTGVISSPIPGGSTGSVAVTVNAACGATGGTWGTDVPGFGGTTDKPSFTLRACALTMLPPAFPAEITSGKPNTAAVKIAYVDGDGGLLAWDGAVSWTVNPVTTGAGTAVGTISPACSGTCTTFTYDVTVTLTSGFGNKFTLTASPSSVSGSSATSAQFAVYSGILNCGDSTSSSSANIDVTKDWSYPYGNVVPAGGWSLIRGVNKTGTGCDPIPFVFNLDTSSTTQNGSFIVPSTVTQAVSAEYVVVWKPVPTSSAWKTLKQPQVAWKSSGGNPVYMPALACVTDPSDFSGVSQGNLPFLLPFIPDIAPYNQPPLSTVYPRLDSNGNPNRMLMCVAQQGWTTVGPLQSNGETLVQPWTKFIDQGDGFFTYD